MGRPKPFASQLPALETGTGKKVVLDSWLPATLQTASGKKVQTVKALSGKVVALYFSAHWCPPCRQFTPVLAKIYAKAKQKNLPFEIVFVSSDDSAQEQREYMKEMHGPWLQLPYDSPQRNALKQWFGCFGAKEQPNWPEVQRRSGIPSLVIVSRDGKEHVFDAGEFISTEGTAAIGRWVNKFTWPK